jgi:hypothetical protein
VGTVSDTRLKRIWVFDSDPSGQVRIRFDYLLGPMAQNRFELKQKIFSEAVKDLQVELDMGKVPEILKSTNFDVNFS